MKVYGASTETYWFINDHLGAPRALINASGQIVWKAAYLPFGSAEVLVDTVENNFRLPGQYYDAETGLHYNMNRYYDPDTGRYITADPIGLDGGINLFAYVGGDPVNTIDLLGLTACEDFVESLINDFKDAVSIANDMPSVNPNNTASLMGLIPDAGGITDRILGSTFLSKRSTVLKDTSGFKSNLIRGQGGAVSRHIYGHAGAVLFVSVAGHLASYGQQIADGIIQPTLDPTRRATGESQAEVADDIAARAIASLFSASSMFEFGCKEEAELRENLKEILCQ